MLLHVFGTVEYRAARIVRMKLSWLAVSVKIWQSTLGNSPDSARLQVRRRDPLNSAGSPRVRVMVCADEHMSRLRSTSSIARRAFTPV